MKIDDSVLQSIIGGLYYPTSPYEFSVLGVDILGNVYEQFLGKVIRLTQGHHAKIEEKPEVKSAGGVYYTPSNIVEYIVKNTVGKYCNGKTPTEISKLKILDPACGSGSFLIATFSFLIDYHRDWYHSHGIKKYSKQIYQDADGQYYLTTTEKKRILLDNIFGVDKDSQAVEVTKLDLLLKVLEGEKRDTLEQQMKLFHERALPDLGKNIKCGNSLIESDFLTQSTLDTLTGTSNSTFDWRAEYPDIMKNNGFDIVIGNPPYLKIEWINQNDRDYYETKYGSYMRRYDAYGLFIERTLNLLLRPNGSFGMIIPSTILNNLSFSKLRKMLIDNSKIERIVNLGGKVFPHVNNDTLILLFSKEHGDTAKTTIYDVSDYGSGLSSAKKTFSVNLSKTTSAPDYPFELRVTDDVSLILSKISSNAIPLGEICNYFQGLVTGSNDAYIVDETEIRSENLETRICKPVVFGDDIELFGKPHPKYKVIYLLKFGKLEFSII
ncbi:MAG: HsdM family class I SAM-dependent methyltransferase [Nitrososphaerales archaeon]